MVLDEAVCVWCARVGVVARVDALPVDASLVDCAVLVAAAPQEGAAHAGISFVAGPAAALCLVVLAVALGRDVARVLDHARVDALAVVAGPV